MKKSLSLVLSIILFCSAFSCLSVTVNAASTSDLTFTLNSDGKSYSVADCKEYASGSLTIPNKYLLKPVTGINDGAFENCSYLTSVTIPDNVTYFGSRVFYGCKKLASVTLPNGITSMGVYAFAGCEKLTSITIPGSVLSIGRGAFNYCLSLKSITIPDSVNYIADFAFEYCPSLTTITLSDSVTSIGLGAFSDCGSLKDVYYSGSLEQRNKITAREGNDDLLNAVWHYAKASKPATPKAKAVNTLTGMNVTWNAVSGAVKYVVYKRLGTSSTWDIVATTTGTSYADNNTPSAGSYYVYSIKAYNSTGTPSDYIKANCVAVQRVIAPYTKAANALDGINVTWGKVAGATKYVVFRRIGTESVWKTLCTTTGTAFLDKNVKAGIYYLYSIRAVNGTGYSAYDVNKRITVQRVVAPYTKAANSLGGINVTWGKVAGANKYVVLRRIGTESVWKTLCTTTGTSFLDKNVTPGIYYIYSIRAVNGTGYSAYDINKRITIQRILTPTAKAVNKSNGIQVSWNGVISATKYNVYRRLGGTSNWIYVGTTTGTSLIDKGGVSGKYYAYSVRAINGSGYSAYDSSKCAVVQCKKYGTLTYKVEKRYDKGVRPDGTVECAIVCYNDGVKLWEHIEYPVVGMWAEFSNIMYDNDCLYFGINGGKFVAIDKYTGKTVWVKSNMGYTMHFTMDSKNLYIGAHDGLKVTVISKSGKVIANDIVDFTGRIESLRITNDSTLAVTYYPNYDGPETNTKYVDISCYQ